MELLHGLKTALAGRYEIEREIGRGGMATVYLARDLKHDRPVALKVLDPELGAVLGVERFLSEIRVTANLQHPNLLPLFDSGEAEGLLYYVMPYVEGESLRHRLVRERQLPIADALHIATAIAGALDLAHRNGIIHRDLKPENILLREGEPVVADFGIALAVSNAGGTRVTQTGLSLGTPQYMSPEQATGDRIIDGRADVYALGAVLYEMLTGEPPHSGPTAQAVIAKLMTEQPRPMRTLRHTVPPVLEAAVMRALEKLPADRFTTAREFGDALQRQEAALSPLTAPGTPRPIVYPWIVAGLSAVVALASAIGWWKHRAPLPQPAVVRFPIGLGEHDRVAPANGIPFAVSPDDRSIVYAGIDSNSAHLLIRRTDELEARVLVPNAGIQPTPAFSPDGKWIAYADAGRIQRISVDGGQPTSIASISGPVAGIVWLDADTVIASVGALVAFPVNGGKARTISTPDSSRGEVAQWGPRISADHKRIFYVSVSADGLGGSSIASIPVSGGKQSITGMRGTTILGSRYGHLLWVTTAGDVVAAPEHEIADDAVAPTVALLEGVLVRPGGAAKAAMSDGGSLIYISGDNLSQIVSVSMNGAVTPLMADVRAYLTPRWSPDGTRLATTVRRSRYSEIWVHDIRAGTATRLTANGSDDVPEWTPDGTRILYRSSAGVASTIRWVSADGSGERGELLGPAMHAYAATLTPDGKTIIYRTTGEAGQAPQVMVVPADHSAPPRAVAPSQLAQFSWRRSPNGRYVAFNENAAGLPEIYVRAIDGGPKVQVSSGGGTDAVWMPDGTGVYYWRGRSLVAARITQTPALAVAESKPLFVQSFPYDPTSANYDVSPDGTRFVMVRAASAQSQTVVVLGWDRELRQRIGSAGAR